MADGGLVVGCDGDTVGCADGELVVGEVVVGLSVVGVFVVGLLVMLIEVG